MVHERNREAEEERLRKQVVVVLGNGMEWSGVEWSGAVESRVEWSGAE